PERAKKPASSSKQAARATPKGSLRMLCAGDTENKKQPEFSVEPKNNRNFPLSQLYLISIISESGRNKKGTQ
ncbi:MAG: hypothetical protein IJN02_08660, partial [Bacteroidales bacterium]|nr:hypothetical protein [Bacteroidales bacterium]